MHDRMVVEFPDVAFGPIRTPPVGALHEGPPLHPVTQIVHARRRREHQRSRINHFRERARIILGIWYDLRSRDMACRVDEGLELPVCYGSAIDPEAPDRDAMSRRFLRIVLIGAHAE